MSLIARGQRQLARPTPIMDAFYHRWSVAAYTMLAAFEGDPMTIEIRRMWANGPLRQWSATKQSKWSPYWTHNLRGYAGQYVCDRCKDTVAGVYRRSDSQKHTYRWLCGACCETVRPKQEQPEALRKYRDRKRDRAA